MSDPGLRARSRVDDRENLTRYVGGSHFDASTGQIGGSAFDRQVKDDDGLSVNRTRIFSPDEAIDRAELRRVLGSRKTLGRTAVFAEFGVGAAIGALTEFEEEIFVCEDPLKANGTELADDAHALLVGLPFKGEAIGSLKSELAGDRLRRIVHAIFPARAD